MSVAPSDSQTSEVAQCFRSVYACNAKELRDLSLKAKDLPSTKSLTALQSQTQDVMYDRIDEAQEFCAKLVQKKEQEVSAAETEARDASDRLKARQEDIAQLRQRLRSLQGDVEERRNKLKSLKSDTNQTAKVAPASPREKASEVMKRRAELAADLKYFTWLLRNLADLSDAELRSIDLLDASPVLEEWQRTVERTERRIEELSREAFPDAEAVAVWRKDIKAQWESVRRARSAQEFRLSAECQRRVEKDQNVQNFLLEQAKMVQWCREQTVQLESLQKADHVQEFCASLQNNNATMEANFLVLSEMAESLLPNTAVQKGLTDVSREWFQLQVYTYERLRQCLMDQHVESKLEDTLRSWSNYFYPVKEYFHTVEGLLLQPTEDEAVAFLTPLLESVRTLQNEAVPHQLIVDHLADFSLRMQCIQENYSAMRPSIFSTLSLMYPALSVHTSVQHANWDRRAEYNQKVSDLADWIDVNGQSEVWENLRKRVDRVRHTIEEEVAIRE